MLSESDVSLLFAREFPNIPIKIRRTGIGYFVDFSIQGRLFTMQFLATDTEVGVSDITNTRSDDLSGHDVAFKKLIEGIRYVQELLLAK